MGDNIDEIGRATFWYDGVLDNISYSPSINELCPYGYFYALSLADYDKQLSEAYVRNTDHQNVVGLSMILYTIIRKKFSGR